MSAHTPAAQAADFRVTAMSSSRRPQRYTDARRAYKLSRLRWWRRARTVLRLLGQITGRVARRGVEYLLKNRGGLAQRHRGAQPRHRYRLPAAGSAAFDLGDHSDGLFDCPRDHVLS